MTTENPADPKQSKTEQKAEIEAQAAAAKQEAAKVHESEQGAATKKPRRRKAAKATEKEPAKATAQAEAKAEAKKPAKKRAAAKKPAAKAAKQPAAEKQNAAGPEAAAPAEPEAAAEPAAEPAAPAASSRRTRAQAKRPPRGRAVRARARYVRTSARKARLVCRQITGKSVHEARAILAFTPRGAARDWSKLLESAVANAESNHELLEDDLFVREAYADEGPTIKRFRPRAMGRATPIHKRTSHLTITLVSGSSNKHDKRR
jgi:ribosomal protein L22